MCVQVLCEKYWSLEGGTVYHGLFQITTVTRKQGPDYFVTTINLRQVRQISALPFHTSFYFIGRTNVCFSEGPAKWQDNHTLLLPVLAGPESPKPIFSVCIHWACAATFGGSTLSGASCGALQVWFLDLTSSTLKKYKVWNQLCFTLTVLLLGFCGLVQALAGQGRLWLCCGWCSWAWEGSHLTSKVLWGTCDCIACRWSRHL